MEKYKGQRTGPIITAILLFLFLLVGVLGSSVSAQMLGDVNNDGVVDIRDVALVQRHILGYDPQLTLAQQIAADVNVDGVVNIMDVNLLMQLVQGHIDSFPTQELYAPALLSPTNNATINSSMVSFQWGAVNGATRYRLEISKVGDSSFKRTIDLGNVTSSTQYNFLNDGSQYTWRVIAGNDTIWGSWSPSQTFTNGSSLPAPSLTYPSDSAVLASTSVSFQWGSVSGATRYQLEVSRVSDNQIFKNVYFGSSVNTTQTDFPNDGTQYRWRVRAGTASTWGTWSSYRYFTNGTTMAAPTLGSPAAGAAVDGTAVTFQWSAVSSATRYNLQVTRTSDGFVFKDVETGNLTSALQTDFPNNGTQFSWRVRAGTATSWGAWSAPRSFISGVTVPIPTLDTPADSSSVDGSAVTFRWGPVTGATRYHIEVVRASDYFVFKNVELGNVQGTTLTDFPNDGTEYLWRVKAGNVSTWGNWSQYRTFTSGLAVGQTMLSSPASAAVMSGTSAVFRWNAVTGATRYNLQIFSGSTATGEPIRDVQLGNVTASEQFNFSRGNTYTWRVRAGNTTGWGVWSATRTLSFGELPGVPTLSSPVTTTEAPGRQVDFAWNSVTGADKYEIEVAKVSNGAFVVKEILGNVTATQQRGFQDDGAQYRWRVRAGSKEGWGPWSAYATFINGVAPTAPVLSRPLQNESFSRDWVNFEWQPVPGATRYQLTIKVKDATTNYRQVVTTGTTSLQQNFPVDGTTYEWYVEAGNLASGWGTASAERTFTVGSPFAIPTLVSPANYSSLSPTDFVYGVEFGWNAVDNAEVYQLRVVDYVTGATVFSDDIDDENGDLIQGVKLESDDLSLTLDRQYKWQVRAGDDDRWGQWSTYYYFVYEDPELSVSAPSLGSPAINAHVANDTVTFTWIGLSGVSNYEIEVIRAGNLNPYLKEVVTSDVETDPVDFPNNGEEFLWRVRAADTDDRGPWSFYRHFTNGSLWWRF